MPATIQFKNSFFNQLRPVETSVTINSNGLITGSAVFLLLGSASRARFPIGSAISPELFRGLQGTNTQGMFVETNNLEKISGLIYLRLGVVGAVNPPIVIITKDTSPRGFSKSESGLVFSFDYQAETITATAILSVGTTFPLPDLQPREINIWNRVGLGFISTTQTSGEYAVPAITVVQAAGGGVSVATLGINATPRILVTESSHTQTGIVNITKTAQFVYE